MSIELLAPAGSPQALRAAVSLGADAVYFGLSEFNARKGAANFSPKEAWDGMSLLHARGKKGYIVLNTLLKDREINPFLDTLRLVNSLEADGVIVQDLGALSLIKQAAPALTVHGSTQMAVHNLAGVKVMSDAGIKRVVLARELSLSEIAHIRKNTCCELEVFIHGALCVCYSGQCYMSSFIGGRSGNRGTCAQPCRLPYQMDDVKGTLLSMKDLSVLDNLKGLTDTKIHSLKIEGRLKNEYYVAAIVDIYRRLLDGDRISREDRRLALGIFNRGGHTNYLEGAEGKKMFCYDKKDNPYNNEEGIAEERYRNLITIAENAEFKIPLSLECRITKDEYPSLTGTAEGYTVKVLGPNAPEAAKNAGLSKERVSESLRKTGGTKYHAADITVHIDENLFVKTADLNAMRRDIMAQLDQIRRPFFEPSIRKGKRDGGKAELIISVRSEKQFLWAVDKDEAAYIFADYRHIIRHSDKIKDKNKIVMTLPRVLSDDEIPIGQIEAVKELGITAALASNIAHLGILKGFRLVVDDTLNIFNSEAALFLKPFDVFITGASLEMNSKEISAFMEDEKIFVTGYGYTPVMIIKNCVKKSVLGACVNTSVPISDRKGEHFIAVCADGHRNELLNPYPIMLSDKIDMLRECGADYVKLSFTIEAVEECEKIWNMFKNGENRLSKFTRGHFQRGVV